jgi:lipopolysaccharide transport system permease protein
VTAHSHPHRQSTVNLPASRWSPPDLRAVWDHRYLVYVLGRRDIAIRYKQTIVGAAWAIIQPVALAAVFTVFLGLIAQPPTPAGVPYSVFALTGMTMWLFFAGAISRASESVVGNETLISKVYFPRLVIPVASLLAPAADFVVSFVVLLVALVAFGVTLEPEILAVPAIFAVAVCVALGLGLWFSALNVRYRDVHIIVPFLIQVLIFVTPVVYALDLVPEDLRALYALNPLVGVLEAFRWAMLPGADAPGTLLLIPVATSIVLLVTGLLYFDRAEKSFADVI